VERLSSSSPTELTQDRRAVRRAASSSPARRAAPSVSAPRLATWWLRVAAHLIDTVLLSTIAGAVFLWVWAGSGEAGTAGISAAIVWVATEYVFRGLVYAPVLMQRDGPHNGQTLGKQVAGIRVVRDDAEPVGYGRAVLREWIAKTLVFELAGAIVSGGIIPLLDYIWPLWDERNQALHDHLAATTVLRTS
jgi:uncharacterized RDD family membrane protein YckC